jgi:hypothetical protein
MRLLTFYPNDCDNCGSAITPDVIQDIQALVGKKLAKLANNALSNKKYDLGGEIDTESYLKLASYNDILEGVAYCNSCYSEEGVEEIIDIVKRQINV